MEESGLPLVEERGRRVYPASYHASDVTKTLEGLLKKKNVQVLLHREAEHVLTENGHVTGVQTRDGSVFSAPCVILATGGLAYPATGSTGDGHRMAGEVGHTLVGTYPSLTALETREMWPRSLQGLSLKNVRLTARRGKKTLYEEQGEMLFTHFGISGPLVLEMSCHLPEDVREAQVFLNLKPALTEGQLTERLQREFDAQPRRLLSHVLESLLPQRLAGIFASLAGLAGDRTCANLTRSEREALRAALQHLPLDVTARRPFAEAIVTRGGVSVREVDPATMQSRLVPGLFLCGELLDVDAHTGGYNLHIAFSTGYLAGTGAARTALAGPDMTGA